MHADPDCKGSWLRDPSKDTEVSNAWRCWNCHAVKVSRKEPKDLQCVDCGTTEKGRWTWHHLDGNRNNYARENLEMVCGKCHRERGKMEVTHLGGTAWKVKSEKTETWYTIDLSVPNCTCRDWVHKRNRLVHDGKRPFYKCKHIYEAETVADQTDRELVQKEMVAASVEAIKARFRKD